MGAATELRTIEQIRNDFDGWVRTFIAPPQDTFGRCNAAGMVTDDFTQGKFILEAALEQNGELNEQVLRSAFRRWMDYPFYPLLLTHHPGSNAKDLQRYQIIVTRRCRGRRAETRCRACK